MINGGDELLPTILDAIVGSDVRELLMAWRNCGCIGVGVAVVIVVVDTDDDVIGSSGGNVDIGPIVAAANT